MFVHSLTPTPLARAISQSDTDTSTPIEPPVAWCEHAFEKSDKELRPGLPISPPPRPENRIIFLTRITF